MSGEGITLEQLKLVLGMSVDKTIAAIDERITKTEERQTEMRDMLVALTANELPEKIEKLIDENHKLALQGARHMEQLITIFKHLNMHEHARAAKAAAINLNVNGPVAGIQTGDNAKQEID